MTISLIVGLGNPGSQYQDTRHNVGWWWIDTLAEQQNATLKAEKKLFAECTKTNIAGHEVILAKPMTFMNESGKAVLAIQQFYKIPIENILVVYDDLDLPVGSVRFKKAGGHGGHNGIRDIVRVFGKPDFLRLRIGIDHPGNKNKVHSYVLSKPSSDDKISILNRIDYSVSHLPDLLDGNAEKFTQTLHTEV